MKFTAHIVIERPLEHVFRWMVQPPHLVQLVTRDPNKDIISNGVISQEFSEWVSSRLWQFWERTETEIEIQRLSTPTLQIGTTFEYVRAVRDRSNEAYPWHSPGTSGSISITQSVPSTLFAFTTKGFSPAAEHHLTFQAQQGNTLLTYTQLFTLSETIKIRLASALPPRSYIIINQVVPMTKEALPLGNELVRQQLLLLKDHMENDMG